VRVTASSSPAAGRAEYSSAPPVSTPQFVASEMKTMNRPLALMEGTPARAPVGDGLLELLLATFIVAALVSMSAPHYFRAMRHMQEQTQVLHDIVTPA
jgi:hypothetical protein